MKTDGDVAEVADAVPVVDAVVPADVTRENPAWLMTLLRSTRRPAVVSKPTLAAFSCANTASGANTRADSVTGAAASRSLTRFSNVAASCLRRPSRWRARNASS